MNEISEDKAIEKSKKILNSLSDSDDFKKSEAKRLQKITLQQALFAKLPSRKKKNK